MTLTPEQRDKAARAEKALGHALQIVWNNYCFDTGEIPPCFSKDGRKTVAQFEGSSFVAEVVAALAAHNLEIREKTK